MDFGFTPENGAFRREVRQFIAEHVTPELRDELTQSRRDEPGPLTRSSSARWPTAGIGMSRRHRR
jgi:hypothetical protein